MWILMNLYFTQQTPGNACAVLQSMGACGTRFQHCHARTRHYNLPWMPTAVGASGPAAPEKDQPALHAMTDEEGRPQDDAGGSREMLCSCWLVLRPKKAIMCVLVTHATSWKEPLMLLNGHHAKSSTRCWPHQALLHPMAKT